jgi:predicted protein tyrosine phosphatase
MPSQPTQSHHRAAERHSVIKGKTAHVLDILDEYRYMDAELVAQFQTSIGEILGLL